MVYKGWKPWHIYISQKVTKLWRIWTNLTRLILVSGVQNQWDDSVLFQKCAGFKCWHFKLFKCLFSTKATQEVNSEEKVRAEANRGQTDEKSVRCFCQDNRSRRTSEVVVLKPHLKGGATPQSSFHCLHSHFACIACHTSKWPTGKTKCLARGHSGSREFLGK